MNYCNHTQDCAHACILNVPIIKQLSGEEKQKILNTSITKTYEKGEMIFSTLDSSANLWVVNTGKVKLSKFSSEGKEQVIRILTQSEFLGGLSLFSDEWMNSNAFALQKTEISIISGHDIKNIIRRSPNISIKFLEVYSKRMKETEEMIEKRAFMMLNKGLLKLSYKKSFIHLKMNLPSPLVKRILHL